MSKKMRKLEKESIQWKSRFEGCNKALIDMLTDVRPYRPYTFHPFFVILSALLHSPSIKDMKDKQATKT